MDAPTGATVVSRGYVTVPTATETADAKARVWSMVKTRIELQAAPGASRVERRTRQTFLGH